MKHLSLIICIWLSAPLIALPQNITTIPRDDRIKLVEQDPVKILMITGEEFDNFLKKSADNIKEYEKRLSGLKEKDADGYFKLAQWCKEKRLHKEAMLCLSKAIAAAPNHKGARELAGWKNADGKWLRNYELPANDIKYVDSSEEEKANSGDKGFETAKNFITKNSNFIAVFKEIDAQLGLFRTPWEIEIGVGFTDKFPSHTYAITRPLGWNEKTGAYRLVVLLNTKYVNKACSTGDTARMQRTIVHEFVHVLCTPATLMWQPLLLEGIAAFASGDPPISSKSLPPINEIKDIDTPAPNLGYAYIRGSAFFDFIKKKYSTDILKKAVWNLVIERQSLSKAVSSAANADWSKIKAEELDYVKSLKK